MQWPEAIKISGTLGPTTWMQTLFRIDQDEKKLMAVQEWYLFTIPWLKEISPLSRINIQNETTQALRDEKILQH